jgi:hypothetical protein
MMFASFPGQAKVNNWAGSKREIALDAHFLKLGDGQHLVRREMRSGRSWR